MVSAESSTKMCANQKSCKRMNLSILHVVLIIDGHTKRRTTVGARLVPTNRKTTCGVWGIWVECQVFGPLGRAPRVPTFR